MSESDVLELVVTEGEYREYLTQHLRIQGRAIVEIEKIGFPFLLASGSEILRTFILSETQFVSTLPDEYRIPERGFMWYLFSQGVEELHATSEKIVIRYRPLEKYRKPFKQFYL